MEKQTDQKEVYQTSMETFVELSKQIYPILHKHKLIDVLNFLNMTLGEMIFMNSETPEKDIEHFNNHSKQFVVFSLKERTEGKASGQNPSPESQEELKNLFDVHCEINNVNAKLNNQDNDK